MHPNLEETFISLSFTCLNVTAKEEASGLVSPTGSHSVTVPGWWASGQAVQPLQKLMVSPVSVFIAKILSSTGVGVQPAWGTKLTVTISFYVKSLNCEITQPPGLLIPASSRGGR